jgi:hypothetical protein
LHCLPSQEIVCLLRSLSSNSRNPTVTKPEFVPNTLKYLASIMRVVVLDRDITLNGQVANALATILPSNARVLHVRYTQPGNPETALRYAFMPKPTKSQCMPEGAATRFRLHVRRCARSFTAETVGTLRRKVADLQHRGDHALDAKTQHAVQHALHAADACRQRRRARALDPVALCARE